MSDNIINNLYKYTDWIQNSKIFQCIYGSQYSENTLIRYRYNIIVDVYSFKNKYIEEIAQRHVNNNNIILHAYANLMYNYGWYFGTFFKYFTPMFSFLIFIFFLVDTYNDDKNSVITKTISYFIVWIKFFFEKLENIKEGFLIAKLTFFFFTIYISSLFAFDDYINYIVFVEWNIPVCFGIILILELIWMLKSHIYIYLNGSKTKNIISATLIEDLINFLILNIRIFLQLIRGIICGIYHDLLREANIKIIIWLQDTNLSWINSAESVTTDIYIKFIYKFIFYIFFLFIVTFALALMFLQALFLFLAVWLFCKCWFMSITYSKFFFKNKINLTRFFKNKINSISLNKSCILFMSSKCNISRVRLFHIYRGGLNCKSKISFYCKTSARKLKANRRIDFKKKKKLFSIFIRTKQWILRKDGSQRKFFNNSVIILKKNSQVWTNHIFGPTTIELKRKKILTIFKNIY